MNTKSPKNLKNFIWHFLKPYKSPLIIYISLAVATGFWGPINNFLIKYIIDSLDTISLDKNISTIFYPAILLIVNFEIHNLCWRGMAYLNYKFQPDVKNKIITYTLEYVHQHSNQFFQDNLAGRISSQINSLADNIELMLFDLARHLIRGVALLLVSLVSMYYIHPKFCWSLLAWLSIFLSTGIFFSKKITDLAESHAAADSMVSGQLVDSITNATSVRIFAQRSYEVFYIQKALLSAKKAFQTREFFELKLHLFQGFSLSIMLSFMLYFLIQLKINYMVTIGDFALIIGLGLEVGFMTWWLLDQIDSLNKARGKCKQSFSTLFVSIAIKDKTSASPLQVSKGEISFNKVTFQYKDTIAFFQNKSVIIEPGQKVGLVGYSGGGKSTFVNLILRLYDINEGQILIDGQDIREVTQDSLHEAISLIPQEPSLFHRALIENIRYGNTEASDEQVIEAAKRAHAHEFIIRLPEGYDSLVGERGIKLSGGQRQRIAIARAILKNAPILILDEATSQLDSLTENDIQESLWHLMQGKTTIVIAHRLSTLLHMDRILVFNNGKICEDGPHHILAKQGGLYQTLWESQVGGFLLDNSNSESFPSFN